MLGCTDHYPATEDTALAGGREVASQKSSQNLQWAGSAGSGKGLDPLNPSSPGDFRGELIPDKIYDTQLNLNFR